MADNKRENTAKMEIIQLRDKVDCVATGKCKQRKDGEKFRAHPKTAESLLKKGFIKPEGKSKGSKEEL